MAPHPIADAGLAAPGWISFDVISATRASAAEIAALQRQRLAALLDAAMRSPWHRSRLSGHDLATVPLAELPVMDKAALMHDFDATLTDPDLDYSDVRAFCDDPALIGQPCVDGVWAWESSGSTGQPGVFVHDAVAMVVYDALEATRRNSPRPWVRLFDPLGLSERCAFVGAIEGHYASIVTVRRLATSQPWMAPMWRCFSIMQPTASLVAQIDAYAPSLLATYPTAAVLLAAEARSGRLRTRPREIWTGGENLTPAMRSAIETGFGARLRNSYGASEFLPIAWECGSGRLHVNADWVILEPVDARHRPVAPGMLSHTTLLTNLANHLQPLIRFDIGDRIAMPTGRCDCGSALPLIEVHGRSDDALVVCGRSGEAVSLLPLALTSVLEDGAGVFDFQLRQTGDRDCRLLLGPGVEDTPARRLHCRRLLVDFAAAQGAAGLRIAVSAVKELPPGRSGKRQRIVAAGHATRDPDAAVSA